MIRRVAAACLLLGGAAYGAAIPIDQDNDAERMPIVAGTTWVADYAFANPGVGTTLASGSDYLPTQVSATTLINRPIAVYNRIPSGYSGQPLDLIDVPNPSSTYGGKQRWAGIGSYGGIMSSESNEQGISTKRASMTVTLSSGSITTGDACTVASTGTEPSIQQGTLSSGTTYYCEKQTDGTILLATSSANAIAGIWQPFVSPGTGTITVTDTTQSISGTATFNSYGLPASVTAWTRVDVITFDRLRLRGIAGRIDTNNANPPFLSVGSIGNWWGGVTGIGNSTTANIGKYSTISNGVYNGQTYAESVGLGSATGSYDAQTMIIITVNNGSKITTTFCDGAASCTTSTNQPTYTAPVFNSTIVVGNMPPWSRQAWRAGGTTHETMIGAGAVTTNADLLSIASKMSAKYGISTTRSAARAYQIIPVTTGQSNSTNRCAVSQISGYTGTILFQNGIYYTNPSNQQGMNYAPVEGENLMMMLTGAPNWIQPCNYIVGGGLVAGTPGKTLMESENISANANTLGPPGAFLNDTASPATPGTPSTYVFNTVSGTAGQRWTAYISTWLTQGLPIPFGFGWYQFENTAYGWSKPAGQANWNITGSVYASNTLEQEGGKYVEGLKIMQTLTTTAFGASSTLPMGITVPASISGGTVIDGEMGNIAEQMYADQNPTVAYFMNGDTWNCVGYQELHSLAEGYDCEEIESARFWAWKMAQAGKLYTEGAPGPSYGQFPRIQSAAGVGGSSIINVTISNPNGAGSLVVDPTYPLLGWGVRTGTTTTAVYTTGATAGSGSCAAGNYEKGGTSLTITGVSLVSPFVVRLTVSGSIGATGSVDTINFADWTNMIAQQQASPNNYPQNPDPMHHMLKDNADTTTAPEPLIPAAFTRYRQGMPVMSEACGIKFTVG